MIVTATKEHLEYLDRLRASGIVNMYGAVPYLQEEFNLGRRSACEVLKQWMASFTERMERGEVVA